MTGNQSYEIYLFQWHKNDSKAVLLNTYHNHTHAVNYVTRLSKLKMNDRAPLRGPDVVLNKVIKKKNRLRSLFFSKRLSILSVKKSLAISWRRTWNQDFELIIKNQDLPLYLVKE